MASFFKHTNIAAQAFYGDFKFKAYYNVWFHLDVMSHFVCHAVRALFDCASLCCRLLLIPFYCLNPFSWLSMPEHFLNLLDDVAAITLTALTITLHPFISFIRTLNSICFGYEEDSEYDHGIKNEEEDSDLACTIW